jgi:hypothetical protein
MVDTTLINQPWYLFISLICHDQIYVGVRGWCPWIIGGMH